MLGYFNSTKTQSLQNSRSKKCQTNFTLWTQTACFDLKWAKLVKLVKNNNNFSVEK